MQALILAGGLGSRLRSVVNDRPKSMVSIEGKPFLDYLIEFLKEYQIVELFLCVGHMHDHIKEYFQDGEHWGVKIQYSVENHLLGTGGALKLAEQYIRGPFLVMNGDTFFDLNLKEIIQSHELRRKEYHNYLGTIALTKVLDASSYGSVRIDQENRILSFDEKSPKHKDWMIVNAGIYILEPKILDLVTPSTRVSLEKSTFPSVLKMGFHLFGYPAEGFFVDIGTPEGLQGFRNYVMENR